MNPRKTAPTKKSSWAAFRYLQEALDYIAALQDKGVDCVYQTPVQCRIVKATDRRVVYRGDRDTPALKALKAVLAKLPFGVNWDSEGQNPQWLKDARAIAKNLKGSAS